MFNMQYPKDGQSLKKQMLADNNGQGQFKQVYFMN
jgi:hypothetical protein